MTRTNPLCRCSECAEKLPYSRAQLHALRILLETQHDQKTFEIDREQLFGLLLMAEFVRSPSCHRCGVEIPRNDDGKIATIANENLYFCSEDCRTRFSPENGQDEPKYVMFRQVNFEGNCEINGNLTQGK